MVSIRPKSRASSIEPPAFFVALRNSIPNSFSSRSSPRRSPSRRSPRPASSAAGAYLITAARERDFICRLARGFLIAVVFAAATAGGVMSKTGNPGART